MTDKHKQRICQLAGVEYELIKSCGIDGCNDDCATCENKIILERVIDWNIVMPAVMAVNEKRVKLYYGVVSPYYDDRVSWRVIDDYGISHNFICEDYPNPIDAVIDALCFIIDQEDDLINNSGIKWVKDNTYNAKLVKEAIKKQPKTKCNCQEEK
jgi:hypothetical protein